MSKRSNACDIKPKVKKVVYERDNGRCIICGKRGNPNAHFIKRSQGGLGIEENVVTLCPDCHYQEDFGPKCKWYEARIEEYLKDYYGDSWNKEKLIYKKY